MSKKPVRASRPKKSTPKFISVRVVTPDGKKWGATIDPEADDETLLRGLARKLHLPPGAYSIALVNGIRLKEKSVLSIILVNDWDTFFKPIVRVPH